MLVTAPPGDEHRLFVVEQTGAIRIVEDGQLLPTPFLDLHDKIKFSSEPGLLSIAFAPDYATSGLFYVFYNSTAGNGDIHISEFRHVPGDPDHADPYSERTLLTIVKPWENHNGGMLQFGPDGYLYASVGDGDSGVPHPPGFFAQHKDDLLGTILRIDPRHGDPYSVPADNPFVGEPDALPEIWAYGLRNPWRFWIDATSRSLYVGDAGNARREEIDLASTQRPGLNFGWPCFEGTLPFDTTRTCDGAAPPLLDYPRARRRLRGHRRRGRARSAARRALGPLPVRRLLRGDDHRHRRREREGDDEWRPRSHGAGADELRRRCPRACVRPLAHGRRLPTGSEGVNVALVSAARRSMRPPSGPARLA